MLYSEHVASHHLLIQQVEDSRLLGSTTLIPLYQQRGVAGEKDGKESSYSDSQSVVTSPAYVLNHERRARFTSGIQRGGSIRARDASSYVALDPARFRSACGWQSHCVSC